MSVKFCDGDSTQANNSKFYTRLAQESELERIVGVMANYCIRQAGDPVINYIGGVKTPLSVSMGRGNHASAIESIRTYCTFLVQAVWLLDGYVQTVAKNGKGGVDMVAVALWLPPHKRIERREWRVLRKAGLFNMFKRLGLVSSWRWMQHLKLCESIGKQGYSRARASGSRRSAWHLQTFAIDPDHRNKSEECLSLIIHQAMSHYPNMMLTIDATTEFCKRGCEECGFETIGEMLLGRNRVTAAGIADPTFTHKYWRNSYGPSHLSITSTTTRVDFVEYRPKIQIKDDALEGVKCWSLLYIPKSMIGRECCQHCPRHCPPSTLYFDLDIA